MLTMLSTLIVLHCFAVFNDFIHWFVLITVIMCVLDLQLFSVYSFAFICTLPLVWGWEDIFFSERSVLGSSEVVFI